MRSWLAFLATTLGLMACTDHGAGALAGIKDEVCACTTASCAEKAMAQVPQRTIASNHRTQVIARDMLDCLAKLQAAERPSTDPDQEDPSNPAEAALGAPTSPEVAAPSGATAAKLTPAIPSAATPVGPPATAPKAAPATKPAAAKPAAAKPAAAKPAAAKPAAAKPAAAKRP